MAHIIAEHGAKIKQNDVWKLDNHVPADDNWKETVYSVMQVYVKRCANSFIEEKEFSIVWHYRNADPQQAKIRAGELYTELTTLTNNLNIQVTAGNKNIEVRIKGINKGYAVKKLLKGMDYDLILAFFLVMIIPMSTCSKYYQRIKMHLR